MREYQVSEFICQSRFRRKVQRNRCGCRFLV